MRCERERERGSRSGSQRRVGQERQLAKNAPHLKLLTLWSCSGKLLLCLPGLAKERERAASLLAKSSGKRRHCHMGDHTRSLRPGCSATGNLGNSTEGTTVVLRLVTLHSLCTARLPLPLLLQPSSSSSSSSSSAALAASWCGAKLQQGK